MESEDLPIPIDRLNTKFCYIHNSFNLGFSSYDDRGRGTHIKPSSAYLACTNWRSVVPVRRGARILLYLLSNESVAVLELVAR